MQYLSQKLTLIMDKQIEIGIHEWVENLQSQGKYAFSLTMLQSQLPGLSDIAAKSALSRLTKKGLIISIHKGYYLIITPQYKSKGILPPTLFLDAFMNELKRPYYLALLNAAAYHGASSPRIASGILLSPLIPFIK